MGRRGNPSCYKCWFLRVFYKEKLDHLLACSLTPEWCSETCSLISEGRFSAGQTVARPVQAGDEAASHSVSGSSRRSVQLLLIYLERIDWTLFPSKLVHLCDTVPSVRGEGIDLYCIQPHTGYNNKSRTFWRNMMSRCKELCSGDCSTSWLKRFTVIFSGRVQKEEQCVGHSVGRVNMLAGSPSRIFVTRLPTSPPPVVIRLWASARFCCKFCKKAWKRDSRTIAVKVLCDRLIHEGLGWWRNHRQAFPTVVVSLGSTDPILHHGNLCEQWAEWVHSRDSKTSTPEQCVFVCVCMCERGTCSSTSPVGHSESAQTLRIRWTVIAVLSRFWSKASPKTRRSFSRCFQRKLVTSLRLGWIISPTLYNKSDRHEIMTSSHLCNTCNVVNVSLLDFLWIPEAWRGVWAAAGCRTEHKSSAFQERLTSDQPLPVCDQSEFDLCHLKGTRRKTTLIKPNSVTSNPSELRFLTRYFTSGLCFEKSRGQDYDSSHQLKFRSLDILIELLVYHTIEKYRKRVICWSFSFFAFFL